MLLLKIFVIILVLLTHLSAAKSLPIEHGIAKGTVAFVLIVMVLPPVLLLHGSNRLICIHFYYK